ncbi:hypothetical protein [Myroides injenensis]|nr:hypothetical protein [Myroides injenensis]
MAQFLRAIFNSLPHKQFHSIQEVEDFTLFIKENSLLDLDYLITLQSQSEFINAFKDIDGMNMENKELLANLLTEMYVKTKSLNISKSILYKEKALWLYIHIMNETKSFNWNIQQKIALLNL